MGSGGGSASGAVDYPIYMKQFHIAALNGQAMDGAGVITGTPDVVSISLADAMNTAMSGSSPYAGFATADVDDVLLGTSGTITGFAAPFTYMTTFGELNFDTLLASYKNSTALSDYVDSKAARITALIAAESALLSDDINTNTLPAFRAGMRDINAVMSSAFTLGEANIWAAKTKALAKTDAVIRLELEKFQAQVALQVDELALRHTLAYHEVKKTIALTALEFSKVYLTARVQADEFNLETDAKDALWDLKIFQYGSNFMGGISGSAVSTDSGHGSNKMQGLLGGAMGGAAMGAMVGGPWGAAIGGAAGGIMGLLG